VQPTVDDNDEARMTNDERSSNDRMTKGQSSSFVIRVSSFLRH
jgi:hypothetical protein